jgi:O-acetyl-ADP-ribose deacetylase (regulator of RNase III)
MGYIFWLNGTFVRQPLEERDMTEERVIGKSKIRLEKGDITDQEIDAFVYYATNDLKLGSGFGTAISSRGGPTIQKELDEIGEVETCAAVISTAGSMKAEKIIHAVGPKFQEEGMEAKLRKTMENSLLQAEKNGIKKLAFPPMGAGFYGIPLDSCAKIMISSLKEHLSGESGLEEVVIFVNDKREYDPFKSALAGLA